MDKNKTSYFERTETNKHREFIISQNNCVLCGTVLELKHVLDHETSEVQEEAFCSCCAVKTRQRKHVLN